MCSPRYQQLLVCSNNQVHKSVKHTTLSLCGGLAGWRRRLEERVAVCHTLRPSRHLFTPPGTRPAKTAGLFWRSAGRDGADMGVRGGGMGLQMGRSRQAGGRVYGWGLGVELWASVRRITEHKRNVSETQWAVATAVRWMIMTLCWQQPQGTWSSVCVWVWVGLWRHNVPVERHSNCGSLDGCDKEADDQLLANFKKTDAEDYIIWT